MTGVIEMQDVAHVQNMMVMPTGRRMPSNSEIAAFNTRLAPIEMAAPSLHLQHAFPLNGKGRPSSVVPNEQSAETPEARGVQVHAKYLIPLCYAACGLILCLCNLLVPDGVGTVGLLLCPVWTLVLTLQAVADADPACIWLGSLLIVLYPFMLLGRTPLLLMVYLVVFAAFAGGKFWQGLHGPPFVLVCVCWFGLATSVALGIIAEHPRAQLSVATFFALALAIISSGARFGQLRLAVIA